MVGIRRGRRDGHLTQPWMGIDLAQRVCIIACKTPIIHYFEEVIGYAGIITTFIDNPAVSTTQLMVNLTDLTSFSGERHVINLRHSTTSCTLPVCWYGYKLACILQH
jgi:hypothetical protein